MNVAPVPHYFNIFPTGNIPVPVCIGDLPMSEYNIPQYTLTEEVANYLEANPLVPGVIVTRNGKISSMISRHKMFERLGHRFGVELFLRKQIAEMERELKAEAFLLKSHITINMAVKIALSRTQGRIYDPIIVEFEDGTFFLLDMYVLLLSQSQLSQNLSGIVSSLNTIEMTIANEQANIASTLELVLESMEKVLPTHHLRIILKTEFDSVMLPHPAILYQNESLLGNSVYRSVLVMNQPVVLEDVYAVPAWSNWDTPKNTRCWLGAPITNQFGSIGLISLARKTFSPFSNHEKEMSLVFSRYLGKLFENAISHADKRRLLERKYSAL